MAVGIRKHVAYVLFTADSIPIGALSWNILVIVGNEIIRHTNLMREQQQGVTNMVFGITGHWIDPCKVVFCEEKLNARVPTERLEFRPNISGVRVEPIMEPLVMQPIMAGSEAPPSKREVIFPQSSVSGSL